MLYYVLFYSILFYSILLYYILFYSIPFCSVLFYSILSYYIIYHYILLYYISFYYIKYIESMIQSDFGELLAGCRWSRHCERVFPQVGPRFWDHRKRRRWSKKRPFSKDLNWCTQSLGQVPPVCLFALPFGLHHPVPLLSRPWFCSKGVSLYLRYPTILRGRISFRKGNTQLQQNTELQCCATALAEQERLLFVHSWVGCMASLWCPSW